MDPRLEQTPGLYLVGFMGCGKSTVGRLLSQKLGWDFVDLDEEIERAAGRSIAAIFENEGEQRFRDLEHAAVCGQAAAARSGRPLVAALGGGAFTFPRNREALSGAGISVWLDVPLETLWERVSRETGRPLARDRDAFAKLFEARRDAYAAADLRIPGAGSAREIAGRILARISE